MSNSLIILILIINAICGLYYNPCKGHYQTAGYSQPIPYQHYSHAPSLPTPTKPQDSVCGFLHGIWKTFGNIKEFKQQQKLGFNWQLYSYGDCPQSVDNSSNVFTPICAEFNNEIRKFNFTLSFELEKFNSGKNWNIVPCPITNSTVCGIYRNEKRLFRNLAALEVEKFFSAKDWVIENCPDLNEPICLKDYYNTPQEHKLSWIIVPCVTTEETTATTSGTTETDETTSTDETTTEETTETTGALTTETITTDETTPTGTTETTEDTTTNETTTEERTKTTGALTETTTTDDTTTTKETTTTETSTTDETTTEETAEASTTDKTTPTETIETTTTNETTTVETTEASTTDETTETTTTDETTTTKEATTAETSTTDDTTPTTIKMEGVTESTQLSTTSIMKDTCNETEERTKEMIKAAEVTKPKVNCAPKFCRNQFRNTYHGPYIEGSVFYESNIIITN